MKILLFIYMNQQSNAWAFSILTNKKIAIKYLEPKDMKRKKNSNLFCYTFCLHQKSRSLMKRLKHILI